MARDGIVSRSASEKTEAILQASGGGFSLIPTSRRVCYVAGRGNVVLTPRPSTHHMHRFMQLSPSLHSSH